MSKSFRSELLLSSALIAILGATAANSQAAENSPVPREQSSRFIKEGQRITVPQGSRLHSELTIEVVVTTEIQRTLEVPGVVQADPARTVEVLSPVAGRVVELKVQTGDRIAEKQELAVIYLDEMRDRYFGAPATPRLGDEPRSNRETGRGEIRESDAANRQRFTAEPKQPGAQLRAIGVPVERMQGLGLLSLRAPVAGSLIDLQIVAAAVVKASDPMMTIANLETVSITTALPRQEATLVLMGEPVQVRLPAYPGEIFAGQASLIGGDFDGNAPAVNIRVAVGNPNNRLKPNMFAHATFFGTTEIVPIVPTSALVSTNETDFVFVEVEPSVFESRAVRIGARKGSQAIVTNGLKAGDLAVVVGGALLLASEAR